MARNDDQITVYSANVCPFCYLGRRSLEAYRGTRDGDVDVVTDVAESVGLDGDEVRTAVADGDLRDRVRDQFTAAQRDGVPTFTYDGTAARGTVPSEQLERLVEGT